MLGDGPTITRRRSPLNVSEGSPTHSPRRVVQYFYQNSVVCFQEQKAFVLKTDYFTHMLA